MFYLLAGHPACGGGERRHAQRLHRLPPSPSFFALLHQLSKTWADSREFWGLAGAQALGEFVKYDADLWRKTSADKGLGKSAQYFIEE